jgi:hypothetical protein
MADIAESDAKAFQDYEALVFDDEFGERSTALSDEGTARRCGRRLGSGSSTFAAGVVAPCYGKAVCLGKAL